MPDALRGEAINLGIVIFRQGEVDVRIGEVLTRAKMLYPELSQETIREGINVLRRFGASDLPAASRHRLMRDLGLFKLGDVGFFTVNDEAGAYEQKALELLRIFTASGRREIKKERAPSKLVSAVRKAFRNERLLSEVGDAAAIYEHKIVPEWPIPMRPSLKASFALRNGVLRVCEVADLSFDDGSAQPKLLFESAVTLDVAKRDADAEDTVFAYRAIGPTKRIEEALDIIKGYASRLVNWEDQTARQQFIGDWTEAARAGAPR
jgi:hypothetical protein